MSPPNTVQIQMVHKGELLCIFGYNISAISDSKALQNKKKNE